MNLTPKDKKVIDAFTDKKSAEGTKLTTDGKRLDGNWMGGNGIAEWSGGKIKFNDLGSKAAQTVERAVRKVAPKSWLKAGSFDDWTFTKTARGEDLVHGYVAKAFEKYLWEVAGFLTKEMRSTSKGYSFGRTITKGGQLWFYFNYKGDGSEFEADKGPLAKGMIHVNLYPMDPSKGYAFLDTPGSVQVWKGNPMSVAPETLASYILGGAAEWLGTWG